MKKGVLGLGSASTLFYINEIDQNYNKKNGGYASCPFLLYKIDFGEINPFLPHQFDTLLPRLETYLDKIKELGVEKLLVPNITLHEALDKLIINEIEIVHAVDLTIAELKKNNSTQIILFGTEFTMNSAYMRNKFQNENINVILPDQIHQKFIDDFRKKVYCQEQTEAEVKEFQNLCYLYSQQAPVVLACTELSINCKNQKDIYDMVQIQIKEFLK